MKTIIVLLFTVACHASPLDVTGTFNLSGSGSWFGNPTNFDGDDEESASAHGSSGAHSVGFYYEGNCKSYGGIGALTSLACIGTANVDSMTSHLFTLWVTPTGGYLHLYDAQGNMLASAVGLIGEALVTSTTIYGAPGLPSTDMMRLFIIASDPPAPAAAVVPEPSLAWVLVLVIACGFVRVRFKTVL